MSYYPGSEKSSRQALAFLLFFLGIGLTVGLYYVKIRAQSAKAEASRLERLVNVEEAAIKVLRAEIAHLENPARLGELAVAELGLEPTSTQQVISLEEIEQKFPIVSEEDGRK